MSSFRSLLLLFLVLASSANLVCAQQVSDTSFYFKINKPAYKPLQGSRILFDQAHNNPFSLKGQYYSFNKLLSQDGYVLQAARSPVTRQTLAKAKIYVSVNAMSNPENWELPSRSAFSEEEVNVIYEWVKDGGSLFLITDHMPCSGSVQAVAGKFGFNLINGFAVKKDRTPEIFSRSGGSLGQHAITHAAGAAIDSIMIWGGAAFIAPEAAEILSFLDDRYEVYLPVKASEITHPIRHTVPKISGLGLANGACLKYGKGRLVIFADGAAFTAQLEGIKSYKRGMNNPAAGQNAQFLLNIMHWLDGLL